MPLPDPRRPGSLFDPNDHELQDAIEEIEILESDRPSVEVHIDQPKRSLVPKSLDTPLGKIVAVIVACGAMAEVIHQLLSK